MSEAGAGVPGLPLPLSGDTRLYLIVGDPIAQAGSPLLFNAAFRALGAKAVLFPAHVAPRDLPAFLRGLRGLANLDGFVVTVPHKIAVMDHVDRIEANGRRVGAVNAVRCLPNSTWVADNFDGEGCLFGLRRAGHDVAGKSVLLVGAGGAGSAVAHALGDAGVGTMRLHDPDARRLDRLAGSMRAEHPALAVETGSPDPQDFDVVVNCTPLGMRPHDPYPVDPEKIRPGSLVVDVILKPAVSPLLEAAAARGCATQPGLKMLEGQVEAILRFFALAGAA